MLKKVVTYINPLTDQEVSEEHYFHLSKADLVEMTMESMKEPEILDPVTKERLDGYRAKLQRITNSQDGVAVIEVVKDMMRRSYGVKKGERFIKSPAIWEEFASTEAFSQMFFEICMDAETQADFMNNIMPPGMQAEMARVVEEAQAAQEKVAAKTPLGNAEAPKKTIAEVTREATKDFEQSPSVALPSQQDPFSIDHPSPKILTRVEALEMDGEELQSGLTSGRYKLS